MPTNQRSIRGLGPAAVRLAAFAAVALAGAGAGAAPGTTLGHPGYVILDGAADSTAGYRWEDGPAPGRRSLVWADGVLTVPDTLDLEGFGPRDLAVPALPALTGTTGGGALVFADGRYEISAPLLLDDGRLGLYAAAGELEIVGQRVRYRPPAVRERADPRAGFVFLAGMVVLVVVLLRLARRRGARSGGR